MQTKREQKGSERKIENSNQNSAVPLFFFVDTIIERRKNIEKEKKKKVRRQRRNGNTKTPKKGKN